MAAGQLDESGLATWLSDPTATRYMERVLLGLILCVAILGEQSEPGDAARSPDISAFIHQLDSLREAADILGLSVAVVKDQALVFAAGLGYADLERQIPATAETPYDVASVARPLSAVVALRLVEEGVLDLDRPMASYSEWQQVCTDVSQQPSVFARGLRCESPTHTLRHLLSHTATEAPGTRSSYHPVLYSWASRPLYRVRTTIAPPGYPVPNRVVASDPPR